MTRWCPTWWAWTSAAAWRRAILEEKSPGLCRLWISFIRADYPRGHGDRKHSPPIWRQSRFCARCSCFGQINEHRARHSIGTLGGGNHFIEVDRDDEGDLYLVIHSGSRHLGTEVAQLVSGGGLPQPSPGDSKRQLQELIDSSQGRRAVSRRSSRDLARGSRSAARAGAVAPEIWPTWRGPLFDDYIHDMKLTQRFALLNRKAMVGEIIRGLGLTVRETVHHHPQLHRYRRHDSAQGRRIRPSGGAACSSPSICGTAAFICMGKGNEDWNCSAPHGAGRLMSRHAAAAAFTVEEFQRADGGHLHHLCGPGHPGRMPHGL